MTASSHKLVALAFSKAHASPVPQEFEELLIFGIISQLSRFMELSVKDMATSGLDRIYLDHTLSYDETLERLGQICGQTRCNFAMTGVLTPVIDETNAVNRVKVTFRLFNEERQAYVVDEVLQIPCRLGTANPSGVTIGDLDGLINQCSAWTLEAMNPKDAAQLRPRLMQAPLTPSMEALTALLHAHQKSRPADRIPLYEAAIQADPALELAYVQLARLARMENEFEKSIFYYRKALETGKHTPPEVQAVYATDAGICCALLGKPELAQQWWQRAIALNPEYINPYFNIANTYEDQENYEQAEAYFLKAQQLDPDDFRTYLNLARIYSKTGAWEKAVSQYRHQLETEDDDPWCHSDAATCYLNLGDVENARKHLQKTVQLDPEGEAGQYAQLILSGLSA